MDNLYLITREGVTEVQNAAHYWDLARRADEDPREQPVFVLAETAEEALCAELEEQRGYLQADNAVFDGLPITALQFLTDKEPRYRYLLHGENGKTYWVHAPWNFCEVWNNGDLTEATNAFVFEYSQDLESCELIGQLYDVLDQDGVFDGWIDESSVINLRDREILTPDEIVLFEVLSIVEAAKPEALERAKEVIFRAAKALNGPHKAARTITEERSRAARENGAKGGRPPKYHAVIGTQGSENFGMSPEFSTEDEARAWARAWCNEQNDRGRTAVASQPWRVVTKAQARKEKLIK